MKKKSRYVNFNTFEGKVQEELDRIKLTAEATRLRFRGQHAANGFITMCDAKADWLKEGLEESLQAIRELKPPETNFIELNSCMSVLKVIRGDLLGAYTKYMMGSMSSCTKYLNLAYDNTKAEGVTRAIKFLGSCIEENEDVN